MNIEKVMYDEVVNEYDEISKMELGSDQYVKTMNGANSAVDRLIKFKEVKNEEEKLKLEKEKSKIEEKKVNDEWKSNVIKYTVTGVTFVIGAAITIWANVDAKHFEQGYTHTTEPGKQSTRKLLSILEKVKL